MINPGTYKATLIDHAISETKNGNLQAVLTFSFDSNGPKTMKWFGSLTEKAAPYTVKSLITCGLKGSSAAGPLEIGKEVSIVVDHEEGQDGKVRAKIMWINPVGAIRNIIPQDLAKKRLAALEGVVMAARNDLENSGKTHAPSSNSNEEMPDWMSE